jgi:hypothetical protein
MCTHRPSWQRPVFEVWCACLQVCWFEASKGDKTIGFDDFVLAIKLVMAVAEERRRSRSVAIEVE